MILAMTRHQDVQSRSFWCKSLTPADEAGRVYGQLATVHLFLPELAKSVGATM